MWVFIDIYGYFKKVKDSWRELYLVMIGSGEPFPPILLLLFFFLFSAY